MATVIIFAIIFAGQQAIESVIGEITLDIFPQLRSIYVPKALGFIFKLVSAVL